MWAIVNLDATNEEFLALYIFRLCTALLNFQISLFCTSEQGDSIGLLIMLKKKTNSKILNLFP